MGCLGTIIGSLILPVILGAVAYALSGIDILFWVVSIVVFILGLPGLLISGVFNGIGDFIHRENEYAQDRADYRELMHDISEDKRMDRYLDRVDDFKENNSRSNIYIDNRQVHYHNHNDNRQVHYHSHNGIKQPRDSKGRFISKKPKE